jgi:mRNA-degrading endonuclease RelE of RelBE toxin-antitoxin system
MKYDIVLSPIAVRDFEALSAFERAKVRDAIVRHLRHEPFRTSRSRIKRLRGLRKPQYRLRVGEIRIFYDVTEEQVQILTIIDKRKANGWLEEKGIPNEKGRPG